VRLVLGPTAFLLAENEEYWEKELEPDVERLIAHSAQGRFFAPLKIDSKGNYTYEYAEASGKRDKKQGVFFRTPNNSACQIYDFQSKKARVVFGPELVTLQPYEDFTLIRLSGGLPKRENAIQNLAMMLGPDFMTDLI